MARLAALMPLLPSKKESITCIVALDLLQSLAFWRLQSHFYSYITTTDGPHRRNRIFMPVVVPRVGDNAVVDLEILKEGRSRVSPSGEFHMLTEDDYRHIQLVIRCVGVRGKQCEFAVYYRSNVTPDRIAYFVAVDYSANRIEKRVVVKDTDGKRVSFAERVDGNPVPFDCFLSYGKEYLARIWNGVCVAWGEKRLYSQDAWKILSGTGM